MRRQLWRFAVLLPVVEGIVVATPRMSLTNKTHCPVAIGRHSACQALRLICRATWHCRVQGAPACSEASHEKRNGTEATTVTVGHAHQRPSLAVYTRLTSGPLEVAQSCHGFCEVPSESSMCPWRVTVTVGSLGTITLCQWAGGQQRPSQRGKLSRRCSSFKLPTMPAVTCNGSARGGILGRSYSESRNARLKIRLLVLLSRAGEMPRPGRSTRGRLEYASATSGSLQPLAPQCTGNRNARHTCGTPIRFGIYRAGAQFGEMPFLLARGSPVG